MFFDVLFDSLKACEVDGKEKGDIHPWALFNILLNHTQKMSAL